MAWLLCRQRPYTVVDRAYNWPVKVRLQDALVAGMGVADHPVPVLQFVQDLGSGTMA
jgi:hypothetical protein